MSNTSIQSLIIKAGHGDRQYWRDIWRFRELFYFLSWRDVLVRYKQTAIGLAWSLLRPFLTMVVFTIVFGKLAKLPSGGTPYPILVYSALLPWQFFSGAFSDAGNSLVANSSMISKVYFPRIIVPASAVIVNLVDFFLSAIILLLLMVWYQYLPSRYTLMLPIFTCVAFIVALGAGLWVAALNVKYRDFRFIIPFIVQFGLYISPVGFSSGIVPEKWRLLYSLNPMVGVIDGFRWAIVGKSAPINWPGFGLSCLSALLLLVTGLRYFRQTERSFADVI